MLMLMFYMSYLYFKKNLEVNNRWCLVARNSQQLDASRAKLWEAPAAFGSILSTASLVETRSLRLGDCRPWQSGWLMLLENDVSNAVRTWVKKCSDISQYGYSGWWWLEHDFFLIFHNIWECHHPNWRTPSFFRGVGQPPTSNGY